MTDKRVTAFSSQDARVRFEVADAEALPYPDDSFDRAAVTCVLHHVVNPERALRELKRVTKPGGLISLHLPCDPGLAYRAGKALGPYRAFERMKTGTDPGYSHYQQHRNHFPGLESILHEVCPSTE